MVVVVVVVMVMVVVVVVVMLCSHASLHLNWLQVLDMAVMSSRCVCDIFVVCVCDFK